MSDAYMGEIRLFAGNYAPVDWALCDGATLAINEYQALYALIGTRYGGDGQTWFALPDLRGRLPIGVGTNPQTGSAYVLAQALGFEHVTLTQAQLPSHSHAAVANGVASSDTPQGNAWAGSALNRFSSATPDVDMAPTTIGSTGGGQAHDNVMPYLPLNFIICVNGLFPPNS